jgi:hypothetical protein
MWPNLIIFCILVVSAAGFRNALFRPQPVHVFRRSVTQTQRRQASNTGFVDGFWNALWKLPFLQPGPQGSSPCTMGDSAQILKHNIEQIYGGQPSVDKVPMADGDASLLVEGSMFINLRELYKKVRK